MVLCFNFLPYFVDITERKIFILCPLFDKFCKSWLCICVPVFKPVNLLNSIIICNLNCEERFFKVCVFTNKNYVCCTISNTSNVRFYAVMKFSAFVCKVFCFCRDYYWKIAVCVFKLFPSFNSFCKFFVFNGDFLAL